VTQVSVVTEAKRFRQDKSAVGTASHLRLAVLAYSWLFLMGAAMAGPQAGDFLDSCQLPKKVTPKDPWQVMNLTQCEAYLAGVIEAQRFLQTQIPKAKYFCAPPTFSGDQAREIFIRWATDHQAGLDQPAIDVIFLAFANAFPCPR
jgi:Rap1a immunity proteins